MENFISIDKNETSEATSRLGARIRMVRGTLSQADFASRIEIPQVTLSNYERGRTLPKTWLVSAKTTQKWNH